jgi:low affinity Fe/Cu permease
MDTPRERPDRFDRFSSTVARITGHAGAFTIAFGAVVLWAVAGPIFSFSDTWQLVINTATTVLTFLMVFVIQNSINRSALATQLKLDELIRVTQQAHDVLIGAEDRSERELETMHEQEPETVRDGDE